VVNRQLLREEHHAVQKDVNGRERRHKETSPPPVVILFWLFLKVENNAKLSDKPAPIHIILYYKKEKGLFRTSSQSWKYTTTMETSTQVTKRMIKTKLRKPNM